ncbi:major facilitator superfamily domain-containing protein [Fennellomyces sp. T-0311]|nr:major facilitator superfamily domain-containing protein [Fennellomyces sp. T-0311]
MLVMVSFQISIFLAALDKTIIATSLPTIGSEFKAMSISSWVINSLMLAFNAFQPLFTKLSDIFGRKCIIMYGLLLFLVSSALCGAATSMIMLIIFRAFQGIGAASIVSMVFVIISDLVPLEKRGNYQGLVAIAFALASVSGPLIGGVFTDYLSWRWSFYINVPLAAGCIFILFFYLHLPMEKQTFKDKLMRIDYAGNFLALAATTLFLLALNFGGQDYPWKSAAVIVSLVLSGVLVVLLAVVEVKYAKEPLMPPRLFKNRTVVALMSVNVLFGMTFYPMIFYMPTYFQAVRGDSATWSGIRMVPMEAAIGAFAALGGFIITKYGVYRSLLVSGIILLATSIGLFSLFTIKTSWPMIYGLIFMNGIGGGLFLAANSIAIQAAVDECDVAVAIGLREFLIALGGSLGVAIASNVLNSTLTKNLPRAIPSEHAAFVLKSPEYIRNGLPLEYFEATITTYADSMKDVWHILTIIGGLGFVCSLFIKHYPLNRVDADPKEVEESHEKQQHPHSIVEVRSDVNEITEN